MSTSMIYSCNQTCLDSNCVYVMNSEREETLGFFCISVKRCMVPMNKKDTIVMLLCAVMSEQFDHGKKRYGQRLEQCTSCS